MAKKAKKVKKTKKRKKGIPTAGIKKAKRTAKKKVKKTKKVRLAIKSGKPAKAGKIRKIKKTERVKIKNVRPVLAVSRPAVENIPVVESEKVKKTKIRVIGIGGGADNIVSELAQRIKKASFVAANTDLKALKETSPNVIRFSFGESSTGGLGTGMNTELARDAAINEKEKIKKLFEGQDFCVFVASLGGGTGSGATPIFAKIAKNMGLISLGIFTLPFNFEGERKMEIARESFRKLKSCFNAVCVLPNERIFQIIDKNTALKEALSAINRNLAEGLEGLIETIYLPGLINIDFADLKTIFQGQGRLAYLNTIEVEGENRGMEAIKKILNSPLYPYLMRGARGILFNIVGGKGLSISEVSNISKAISEMANSEARIIFGISQYIPQKGEEKNKKSQEKIKITLLATGCATKVFPNRFKKARKLSKKKKIGSEPAAKKKIRKMKTKTKSLKIKTGQKKKNELSIQKRAGHSRRQNKSAAKKVKIKILPKKKETRVSLPEGEKNVPLSAPGFEEMEKTSQALFGEKENQFGSQDGSAAVPVSAESFKIRKNAVQVKKEAEEVEEEILKKEKTWDLPAFLRRQQK